MTEVDRAWADYSERFRDEVLPKILNSGMFMSLGGSGEDFDVKQATEIGAALLMDKPLLLVVPPGKHIGSHLRRAADEVVENWDPKDTNAQERLARALKRLQRLA